MRHNARIVAALLTKTADEIQIRLAKAYARAHGHRGGQGGWIYDARGTICQGWGVYADRLERKIRDWATRELTAFRDFAEMVNARGGYRPTMRCDADWRFLPLAVAYDTHQARVGDPRRAYRALPY